ncbi:uncharacterized protein [Palaemon carinicauda]|uniref:uncharacterized protein n=1 Tax=Palaemon carinicauda TaxID=392227 RepID=UPI0035B68D34
MVTELKIFWMDVKERCVEEKEELMGRTSGYGVWKERCKRSVNRKSKAFKDWKVRRAQGAEKRHRKEEKDSRRKVGIGIGREIEQLNEMLGTREGEKKLMKMQRQDFGQLEVTKDRDGNLLHRANIKRRCSEYFEQLLNTEKEKEEM